MRINMKINNTKQESKIKSLFSIIKKVHGDKGKLTINNAEFEIENINITINDEILGNFNLISSEEIEGNCIIEFESDNNFNIKCKGFCYKNFNIINFKALSIEYKKGKCDKDKDVQFYSFVENLKIIKSIHDFETEELDGVHLVLYQNDSFPKINGYFYKESTYSDKETIEEQWKALYFLLKLYSAGKAFNNINCIISDNHCEISISLSNLDFVKNHHSCFYVNEKDNLLNFIKSSYSTYIQEKNNSKIAFDSFIHYMSILIGNNEDFNLMPSFIALEILAVGNGILLDDDTFLQDRLDNLLNELKISKESLNNVFAEDLKKLKYIDYLRCLIEYRSKILHGVVVNSYPLSLLIINFLTIILLKILNINCSIYLPLLDEIKNSKEFVDKFKVDEQEINKTNDENNVVKIFKKDNELYLPLTIPSLNSSIKVDDRYRIITFKTLGENGRCLRNIKIDKR